MNRRISPWLALALVGCFGSAPETASTAPQHPLPPNRELLGIQLGTVNAQPIGSVAGNEARGRKMPANGSSYTLEEKKAFLNEAVTDELLFQEAFKRGLYQIPAIRRQLEVALLREEVYDKLDRTRPTDNEIAAWFADHKDELTVPERVAMLRIFIAQDPSKPEAALAEITKYQQEIAAAKPEARETTFREIAKAHSHGPFARTGGDAGILSAAGRPGLPPEAVAKAFKLDDGTLSEPFQLGGGWNLVYTISKRERIERTLEDSRGAIVRRINIAKTQAARDAFLATLRERANIVFDDAAVEAWRPSSTATEGVTPPAEPAPPQPIQTPPPGMKEAPPTPEIPPDPSAQPTP